MPQTLNNPAVAGPTRGSAVRARGGSIGALLRATRPRQWIKNSVIFAALVFSHTLTDAERLWRSAAAFALFCAVSSAVYLINDVLDISQDRVHPTKSRRPVAAGEISPAAAVAAGGLLAIVGLGLSYLLSPAFAGFGLVYLLVNVLYSAWLKKVVILDVMIVSSGFVIRAVAGGIVIGVEVSAWLILCAILLSLFLALTKRRQELALLESPAGTTRETLKEYSVAFLDQMISIVTAATLVAYFLYTLAPDTREKLGTPWLPLTIPFVLYGIFRYLYLVHQMNMGENPTAALYKDRPLLIDVVLWVMVSIMILYLGRWTP